MAWTLDGVLWRVVDRLLKAAIVRGHLTIVLPDGVIHEYGELTDSGASGTTQHGRAAPAWKELPRLRARMTVINNDVFYKIITRHDVGMAQAFMAGDFVVDDLGSFLAVITANAPDIQENRGIMGVLNWLGAKALRFAHMTRSNTIEGSRKNISEHYDAGNEMYKLFLDPSMTYSGAMHEENDTLEQAQYRKLDQLIQDAQIGKDSHVLEIGCGWGSCAIRAAQQTGCKWTGITVSQEQLVEARLRVKEAGLCDRVSLLFCDYRDVPGHAVFDAVVSCEMIEAVGHEHLPTYFAMVGRVLKPGGLFAMQVITVPDGRYEAYCNSSDFIRELIFPGGHLPSMSAMLACAGCASLGAVNVRDVGRDYAITLRAWRKSWVAKWDEIRSLGYPDTFMRKYEFYFAFCEAPFDSGYLHNFQITWKRHAAAACEQQPPASAEAAVGTAGVAAPRGAAPTGMVNDPFTLALVAVYFLLVGAAIGQQPHPKTLWMAPITCALCMILFQSLSFACLVLMPGFSYLPQPSRAWFTLDCVHLLFSALLGASSLLIMLGVPSALSILPQAPSIASSCLVAVATGFFGFQLWALLRHSIHKRCPKAVLHFTVLLLLFGVCAFKREHTGLLAYTLPAELAAVPELMAKMCKLLGREQPRHLQATKFVLDCILRVLLHSVIAGVVLFHPSMWSSPVYYLLACVGLVYVGWLNCMSMMPRLRAPPQRSGRT